jgi:hypothetical protein
VQIFEDSLEFLKTYPEIVLLGCIASDGGTSKEQSCLEFAS